MAIIGKVEPKDVFTPRRAEVNREMYVARPDLERKLKRAIEGTQHVIVFGDSGSGKTWLYRKYFEDHGIEFKLVDLSIAVSRSLSDSFRDACGVADWIETNKTERKTLDAHLIVATPQEERVVQFEKRENDHFLSLLETLKAVKGKTNFIVFDNFEQISRNDRVVEELASLILRLDNPNFAKFNVRFLFVGVVADMKELLARHGQFGTLNNRLTEVPEVTPLTDDEANTLLKKGFENKLRISFENQKEAFERIKFVTCRNAQQLHELCYYISSDAVDNGKVVSARQLEQSEADWIEASLNQHVAQVESRMNKRDTRVQRRNQVLYCIGAMNEDNYRSQRIEEMVRNFFPETASVRGLGVDQILAGLAKGDNPILIKNPNDASYRLSHPKLRLAIRVRLEHLSPKKIDYVDLIKQLHALLSTPAGSR